MLYIQLGNLYNAYCERNAANSTNPFNVNEISPL